MSRLFTQPFEEVVTRPGISSRLIGGALGGLSTFGAVLDTPGSVIRGVLAGDLDRALSGILDVSQRVSGTELVGGDKDKFTWGGLVAEILTDPLTFLSFGTLTTAGKIAKRSGDLGRKIKSLESFAKTGDAPLKGTIKRLADAKAALAAHEAKASSLGINIQEFEHGLAGRLRTGQSAGVQLSIPFVSKSVPVAELRGLAEIVDFGNQLLKPVKENLRSTKKLFVTREDNLLLEETRRELKRIDKEANRQGLFTNDEVIRRRSLLEAQNPNVDINQLTRRIVEEFKGVDPLTLPKSTQEGPTRYKALLQARLAVEEEYGKLPDDIWDFAMQTHVANQDMLAREIAAGAPVTELPLLGYVARIATPEGLALFQKSKRAQNAVTKFLTSQPGGLAATFQRERTFRDLTIDKLNDVLRAEFKKDKDFMFFDTDLARIQTTRSLQGEHVANRARFAQVTVDLFAHKKALKTDVGIENIIGRPTIIDKAGKLVRGPLVTSTQVPIIRDIDAFVKRHTSDKAAKIVTSNGQHTIQGFKLPLDSEIILEKAAAYGHATTGQEDFRAISPVHAELDDRFLHLQQGKALTETQVRFLRVMSSQLDDEAFEIMRRGGKLRISTHTRAQSNARAHLVPYNSEGVNHTGNRQIRVDGTPIESITDATNPVKAKLSMLKDYTEDASSSFLHEIGHIMSFHLAHKNPEFWKTIQERYVKLIKAGGEQGTVKRSGKYVESPESLSQLLDETALPGSEGGGPYFSSSTQEWFAETFSQWMLGTRVPDSSMELALGSAKNGFEAWRNMIEEIGRFKPGGFRDAFAKGTINYDKRVAILANADFDSLDLVDLFPGTLKSDVEQYLAHPRSTRGNLMKELLQPEWTREGRLRISETSTNKQIVQQLKDLGVEERFVDKEIFDAFQRITKVNNYTPDGDTFMGKFINVSDQIHGLYRTAFTQYFPAFHARNWISNVFLNTMAGVVSPLHYFNALREMREMTPERVIYLSGMGVLDEGKLRETFDILASSRGGIKEGLKTFFSHPVTTLGHPDQAIRVGKQISDGTRKFGQMVENHTRYAHFLAMKSKGLSDVEAADSVAKFLFDYSDLTAFERAVPRRAMLFYTFTRKNLPLMMETSFKNPRFMATYARVTGQTNENIVSPAWLPGSFFLGEDEKGRTIRANFGLPPEDLARFDPHGKGLARIAELMISNLVPAIKEPFQFISGRDLFLGRPLEGGLGARLAAAAPTARATSSGSRFLEAAGGETERTLGGEAFRFATGINVRAIDTARQEKINGIEIIRNRLDELVRKGKGRKFEIVGQRKGGDIPEIRQLNQMQSRLQSELKKLEESSR